MRRHRRLILSLLFLLIGLTVAFIWGNSCLSRAQSTQVSDFVMRLLGLGRRTTNESVFYVRKTGHFLEFLALGGELSLLFVLQKIRVKETLLRLVSCGLFFPVVDETIQMFNDRSALVRDIWIDVAGYTLGCLLVLLICCLACRLLRLRRGATDNLSA